MLAIPCMSGVSQLNSQIKILYCGCIISVAERAVEGATEAVEATMG